MEDIIRDLYYGNYAVFERTYTRDSEQAKALAVVVDLEEQLMKELPPELQPIFKQYDDAFADLASITSADSFVEGYRLGVKMILAAFPDNTDRLEELISKHVKISFE